MIVFNSKTQDTYRGAPFIQSTGSPNDFREIETSMRPLSLHAPTKKRPSAAHKE